MLVFTLVVERLVPPDAAGVHDLLIATLSYSLVWAVFVGVMYAVHRIDRRGKIARFAQTYHVRPNESQALETIRHELDSTLAALTNSYIRERLHWQILSNIALCEPDEVRVQAKDFFGALTTFSLVFSATLPAILPFLYCNNLWLAVRLSNFLTITLLVVCSYAWARQTKVRPLAASGLFASLGLSVVAISQNIP